MKLQVMIVDLELSRRQKRWLSAIAIPLVLGTAALAYAAPARHWDPGQTLNAMDLNVTFEDLDTRLTAVASHATTLDGQVTGILSQSTMFDGRITSLEQTSAALPNELLGRLAAGTTIKLPSGSNGTLAGQANPSTTQMTWQSASAVVQTDASSIVTISFPTPFPNGLLSVVAVDGDFNAGGVLTYAVGVATTNQFQVKVAANGNAFPNAILRFNWIAIGW